MDAQQKKLMFGVLGAVALAIVLGAVFFGGEMSGEPAKNATTTGQVKGQDAFRPENAKALPTVEGGTREVLAQKVEVPLENAKVSDTALAVPTLVSNYGGAKGMTYEVKGIGGKFSPSKFAINAGDVVTVKFTATDGDYDFRLPDMGIVKGIAKGQTAQIQFQGYDYGQFKILCGAQICGGAANPVQVGTLLVNQK